MVSPCCGSKGSRHQSYGTHRGSNVILDRWTSLTYARKSMFYRVACGPFLFASKAIANWQCYVEPATYRWFSPDAVTFPRVWVTKTLEPPLASSPYFIFFTRNNMRLQDNAVCGLGISELCSSANNRSQEALCMIGWSNCCPSDSQVSTCWASRFSYTVTASRPPLVYTKFLINLKKKRASATKCETKHFFFLFSFSRTVCTPFNSVHAMTMFNLVLFRW